MKTELDMIVGEIETLIWNEWDIYIPSAIRQKARDAAEKIVIQTRQIAFKEVEEWLENLPAEYKAVDIYLEFRAYHRLFRERFLPGEVKK